MEEGSKMLHNTTSTVALAISGRRSSKYVIQWALNKFTAENRIMFKLLYVQPKIRMVPTPMGNYLPIDQVRDDVAAAYRKEEEWRTQVMLLPYKKICTEKKIETEVVVLEADDVAEAIAREITENTISRLVIGVSSRNKLIRKFKGDRLSSRIAECAPPFCTVFVISNGKLSSVRQPESETDEAPLTSAMNESTGAEVNSIVVSCSGSSNSSSLKSELIVPDGQENFPSQPSLSQVSKYLSSTSKDHEMPSSIEAPLTRVISLEDTRISTSNTSDNESIGSLRSLQTDKSWNFDVNSSSYNSRELSPSRNEGDIDLDFERLRTEMKYLRGMLTFTQSEPNADSQQLDGTHKHRIDEMLKLQELWLEKASKIAEQVKGRGESSNKEVEYVHKSTKREVSPSKDVGDSAADEALEKGSFENIELTCGHVPYTNYTWEEIVTATLSFSETRKIGVGANGTVYRGRFHHTMAAVKVLHSNEGCSKRQFTQELEVLSRVHHPHVLLLLGACPDKGCLVYEYMENGSLEDRLQCKNNTQPLPWSYRFRIAWEVASALTFLHNSKPEPIIHRDLKPANVLLDHNFVSKIGDAGLSTLLPTLNLSMTSSMIYKDTAPVGTFFYIDPEYQRTGLVSAKSDTYALGMVILQLLTGQPPMGLAVTVEDALEKDCLTEILDPKAGKWPQAEAKELAVLGLLCSELRGKDRPDLEDQVLPVLERLKDVAEQAHDSSVQCSLSIAPSQFICPLMKVVMDDPCIASDGYTYDRNAIERWFRTNDMSPMTNLPLPSKDLIPNNSLLSAIREWKNTNQ